MAKIAIGADHAGFGLKVFLAGALRGRGSEVLDLGTNSAAPVDYPPFCIAVGEAVAAGKAEWGIVLGGSGQGEQIAANKVVGVRAALCHDLYLARLAREHNDANILAMGARVIAPELALEIVGVFAATTFAGGRHVARLAEIARYERGG